MPTFEELKAQVEEEIPYKIGDGQGTIQARTRRLKDLMNEHGIPVQAPRTKYGFKERGGHNNQHPRFD